MDYEKLLESAYEKMPKDALKTERFEVPRALGHIQGNRTVISNFYQIANVLGRKPEHLLKYVLRELATPGELTKNALIIGTKVSASRINEKIQQYVKELVLCRECKRPDTKLSKVEGVAFMKCSACGARYTVK
jgi:translation initiation factor 2 subunit 2